MDFCHGLRFERAGMVEVGVGDGGIGKIKSAGFGCWIWLVL